MIAALVSGLATLGSQWLANRSKIADAKAERQAERIRQDGPITENLTKGFKDEAVLITVFSPVWVSMIGAIIGDADMVQRGRDVAAVMREYAPGEVWAGLILMTAVVSLGGRVTDVLDRVGWAGKKK